MFSSGAIHLWKGVEENHGLVHLDVSHNGISCKLRDSALSPAGALAQAIQQNRSLRHLDISYCKLSVDDCREIGTALTANSTIMGIHAEGNDCIVDSCGFVVPMVGNKCAPNRHAWDDTRQEQTVMSERALTGRLTSAHLETSSFEHTHFGAPSSRCFSCWICSRWRKHVFVWNVAAEAVVEVEAEVEAKVEGKSGASFAETRSSDARSKDNCANAPGQVIVHLSIDRYPYMPTALLKQKDGVSYAVTRMIPTNVNVYYFFTVDGVPRVANSEGHLVVQRRRIKRTNVVGMPMTFLQPQLPVTEYNQIETYSDPETLEMFNASRRATNDWLGTCKGIINVKPRSQTSQTQTLWAGDECNEGPEFWSAQFLPPRIRPPQAQ